MLNYDVDTLGTLRNSVHIILEFIVFDQGTNLKCMLAFSKLDFKNKSKDFIESMTQE